MITYTLFRPALVIGTEDSDHRPESLSAEIAAGIRQACSAKETATLTVTLESILVQRIICDGHPTPYFLLAGRGTTRTQHI
jgi:hypothetical protein